MKLIVACDPKGGIGYHNRLPWSKIEGDLPRFKKLTQDKTVVMGRNTWDSLPVKPLPNRINVVVTTKPIVLPNNVKTIASLDDLKYFHEPWIMGGARLIQTCWERITKIHLTTTFAEYACDTFIDLKKLRGEFRISHEEVCSDHTYEIWDRDHPDYWKYTQKCNYT